MGLSNLVKGDYILVHAWVTSVSKDKEYRIKFGEDKVGKVYNFHKEKRIVVVDFGMVWKSMMIGNYGYLLHYKLKDVMKVSEEEYKNR